MRNSRLNMNVEISGSVLSSLFFEHSVRNNDLEGFFLGRVTSRCTDTISDAQISGIKEETTCYISSYVSSPKPFSWYESSGAVDVNKLTMIVSAEKVREVVGWYKFRRNSTLVASMRERAVHRNLLRCLPGVLAHQFVFLLCTLQQTVNKSTHMMDHVFQIYNGSCFQGIPVSVINLGDNVSRYKFHGASSCNNRQGKFTEVINKHCDSFLGRHGQIQSVIAMHDMSHALNEQLQDLCTSVWSSEDEVQQLRKDVRRLRAKLTPQRQKPEPARQNLNPFKTVTSSEVSGPQTRLFSPKNPFYSGYQPVTLTSVYGPPPPYSANDDLFRNETSSYASGSVQLDVPAPDIDLIALSDSDDLQTAAKYPFYDEFSNSADSLLDQPTTLLDTSIPEFIPETEPGWNITGPEMQLAGAFGSCEDRTGLTVKLRERDLASADGQLQQQQGPGENSLTKTKVLEAIEQSSDEEQRET